VIAGISFELIKFAGRNRRKRWVQAVMWPGLKLQLLTTREPDLEQLAVAIASLEAVLALETPGSCRRLTCWRGGRGLRAGLWRLIDWVAMIEDLVKQIEARFAELGAQMTDADVISDRERYAEVGRAYSQLEPVAKLAEQWRHARDDAAGAENCWPRRVRTPACARSSRAPKSGSRSWRRRFAWRWSSVTPTTRRA